MPAPAHVEILPLYRSKRQGWLNVGFMLLSAALLWPYLSAVEWAAVLLLWSALSLWVGRRRWRQARLRYAQQSWWLDIDQRPPLRLVWRAGSVRRRHLIIWQYGRWPWQRLLIRPDSLPAGEFSRLVKALY